LTEEESKQYERFISLIVSNLSSSEDKFAETAQAVPEIRDPWLILRPQLGLLEPDALEVARQLTLMHHEKYRAIHTREFMIGISERSATIQTPTLMEFFAFGDFLTLYFAEAFATAQNREAAYTKILEIVKCLAADPDPERAAFDCANWDAIACLVRFLMREDILKLGGRSSGCPPSVTKLWEGCGGAYKSPGGRTEYDATIAKQAADWRPTIPNMHVELKAGDKESRKQPDVIGGMVNWEKLQPLATKCKVLSVFQKKKYPFVPIPQLQRMLLRGAELTAEQIEETIDEAVRLLPKE
jgi:hypothetical protein